MNEELERNLQRHAKQICLAALGIDLFEQIEVGAQHSGRMIPHEIMPTHEFMVWVDFGQRKSKIKEARRKMSSFLGKAVEHHKTDRFNGLTWGEGDPLNDTNPRGRNVGNGVGTKEERPSQDSSRIQWLKADTALPQWLDRLLFENLDARYAPDPCRFERNLDSKEEDIQIYLGTYFPRSYAEAFCILDDLFRCGEFTSLWKEKSAVCLLDIGCGTGGNVIGTLVALKKNCPNLEKVYVEAYDGNPLALEKAKYLFYQLGQEAGLVIECALFNQIIRSSEDLPKPTRQSFDFISSFKMGSEVISAGAVPPSDGYMKLLQVYSDYLSEIGLLTLLDVTIRSRRGGFYPQLLNSQTSSFVTHNEEFGSIIPIPCFVHERGCTERCFSQKEFSVRHRGALSNVSRVAYRVIGRRSLSDRLHTNVDHNAEYIIKGESRTHAMGSCGYSAGLGLLREGFRKIPLRV